MSSRTIPAQIIERAGWQDPIRQSHEILMVGMTDAETRTVPPLLFGALSEAVVPVSFDGLTRLRLAGAFAVLSPLVGPGFDAVDLAGRLERGGFKQRYIAYAARVDHADLISAEVRNVAPHLTFNLVATGEGPRLAKS